MKYIRTKDGVYEIERYYEPRDYYWVKQDYDNQPIGSEEVLKQADTIEELCDTYVIKGEFGIYLVGFDELDRHAMGQTKEELLSGKLEAYGAIWVIDDNGAPTLKSVAKANKDGKLCLI